MNRRLVALTLFALGLMSCEYEFPLTAEPTQHVDARVIGDWTSATPERKWMKIRRLDDTHYIVVHEGDLFRAHHSTVAGIPLVSVQDLDKDDGKWAYMSWQLSESGKILTLRLMDNKIVPYETSDAAAAQKLIAANRDNPKLFGDEIVFRRN